MAVKFTAVSDATLAAGTPAEGEYVRTTDGKKFYMGDGATQGGILIGPGASGGTGNISDGDTLTSGLTFPVAGLHILDTNGSYDLIVSPGSALSADRTLTLATGNLSRTLTFTADASIGGTNTGDQDLSGYVTKATYDANTLLIATADNTPIALTVAEQTLVGRITSGAIDDLSPTQVRTLLNVADGANASGVSGDAYATSHEADTTAHTAANIVNVPAGNIAAVTVQAALNELDTEKSGTSHTHSGIYEPVDATIIRQADVDDVPVNGVTMAPVSSNWAYDHAALVTAHGISTVAATVLDDASLIAMVNTLGEASSTGTGGLVRAASPTFTGVPLTPTAPLGTNTTQLASTAFVAAAVAAGTGYTNEQAQDAVGSMVANSPTVTLAYVDATPSLTASLAYPLYTPAIAAGALVINANSSVESYHSVSLNANVSAGGITITGLPSSNVVRVNIRFTQATPGGTLYDVPVTAWSAFGTSRTWDTDWYCYQDATPSIASFESIDGGVNWRAYANTPEDTTLIRQADVDDTPVNGVTTAPVSSNWAFDHAALVTAHGISTVAATVLDDATIADMRTTLGLGTAAVAASGDFAAASHAHGNITSAGAIGSTASLPIITTTSGVLTAGAFGTGATQFCVGNDSRLSDARTPVAHNQAETTITFTDVTTGNASTTAHGFSPKTTAPAAGLISVLAIANGETVRSDKALFDATNPAALGTAAPGSATTAARRDHVHVMPSAANVGAAAATSFIAGAGALTGPASPLTIGTAAAAATGDFIGKQVIYIPAVGMVPSASGGCAPLAILATSANYPDLAVLDFDGTTTEYAQFGIGMPNQWDEGTITFQVYWTVSAAVTTGVVWGLQAVAVSDSDPIGVSYGTGIGVTDTGLDASNDMHVTAVSTAVTIGGTPTAGDMVYFRLYRYPTHANDTMTQDARLIGVKIFWTQAAGVEA